MTRTFKRRRVVYARGFPYGAPLVILRGGGLGVSGVKGYIREAGFRYDPSAYGWTTYMDRRDFGAVLRILRDAYDLDVVPKETMHEEYRIDLDDPDFGRPFTPADGSGTLTP